MTTGFNTASGMDCMQSLCYGGESGSENVSIPQAVWIACNLLQWFCEIKVQKGFNTASGMDCMQYCMLGLGVMKFLRFNTASGMDCMQYRYSESGNMIFKFQYRKRYGLHAMSKRERTC